MSKAKKEIQPPPSDRVVAGLLTTNAVVSDLLTRGIDVMLRESGMTPGFRRTVAEFLRPAITLLEESERDVIQYVQHGRVEELPFAEEIDNEPDLER